MGVIHGEQWFKGEKMACWDGLISQSGSFADSILNQSGIPLSIAPSPELFGRWQSHTSVSPQNASLPATTFLRKF